MHGPRLPSAHEHRFHALLALHCGHSRAPQSHSFSLCARRPHFSGEGQTRERNGFPTFTNGETKGASVRRRPALQPFVLRIHPTNMIMRAAPTVRLSLTAHPPRQSLPSHEHRDAYLSIVIEGDYLEQVGTRAVLCPPLQVRFHPPGEVHADLFGVRGGHVLNLELDEIWNAELDVLGLTDPHGDLLSHDGVELGLQAWRNRGEPLVVEDAVARLLHRARDARREMQGKAAHAGIRKAIAYLRDSEGPFSLFDVASAAGLHATHLSRIFRRRMDCTVGAYARRVRFERSLREMHAHPEWSISRVALEAGFTDHPHLTRDYQHFAGAAPSRLRRDMAALRATAAAR